MKVLAINCGSSTLKFHLIEMGGEGVTARLERWLAHGIVDRIGENGFIEFTAENGEHLKHTAAVADYGEATQRQWLTMARRPSRCSAGWSLAAF